MILSLFFLTANSNFAADRNLPFSTARCRRYHGHGGESDRRRRATRPQAALRPLPPPVRAVAAVEARRGLERGRQPDPPPAAGHAAAAAAGAGAGRRAGHHQGGALRAGGSARRPRRARRRQAPTRRPPHLEGELIRINSTSFLPLLSTSHNLIIFNISLSNFVHHLVLRYDIVDWPPHVEG